MSPRRSQAAAASTHETIVREAAESASEIGLEGLSIGNLAASVGMSKAGVAGHFGSKRDLQMEVVQLAAEDFSKNVWAPNSELEPGRERLLGCLDTWYAYSASSPFRGGCLMTAISTEFDGRPGPIRTAIAESWNRWNQVLTNDLNIAISAKELDPPLDPAETIMAVGSLASGVNQQVQLYDGQQPQRAASAAARILLAIES